jgi:hypothetical protein
VGAFRAGQGEIEESQGHDEEEKDTYQHNDEG